MAFSVHMVDQVLARYKCDSNTAVRFKLGEATCWCLRKFMVVNFWQNVHVCEYIHLLYCEMSIQCFLCVFITILNALFDDASHFFLYMCELQFKDTFLKHLPVKSKCFKNVSLNILVFLFSSVSQRYP